MESVKWNPPIERRGGTVNGSGYERSEHISHDPTSSFIILVDSFLHDWR